MHEFVIENGVLKKYTGKRTEIIIPDNVTTISKTAFSENSNIVSITFPDSVVSIENFGGTGTSCFANCSSLNQETREKIKSINPSALDQDQDGSVTQEVPVTPVNSLKSAISNGVFSMPESITDITHSNTQQEVEADEELSNFVIEMGVLIKYVGKNENIVIPNSVTTINKSAFYECEKINSITFPDTVVSIADYAFSASKFDYLLPSTKKQINNINPKALETDPAHSFKSAIANGVFDISQQEVLVPEVQQEVQEVPAPQVPPYAPSTPIPTPAHPSPVEDFEINDGVLVRYRGQGGDVVIPPTVKSIGYGAFNGCHTIISATLLEPTELIGVLAFSNCVNLVAVTLPNSLITIGAMAFSDSANLGDVVLSESVTTIGNNAFKGCNLTHFAHKQIYNINPLAIEELENSCPEGVQEDFKIENDILLKYNGTGGIITLPENIHTIGDNAFANRRVTEIVIPDTVTSIGDNAFSGCAFTSITIPSSVVSLGTGVFKNCKSLTKVNLLNQQEVQHSTVLPAPLDIIKDWTFFDCVKLEEIILPHSVVKIGTQAFANCYSLVSITFPASVENIATAGFSNCNNLHNITFLGENTKIEYDAFVGCSKLSKDSLDLIAKFDAGKSDDSKEEFDLEKDAKKGFLFTPIKLKQKASVAQDRPAPKDKTTKEKPAKTTKEKPAKATKEKPAKATKEKPANKNFLPRKSKKSKDNDVFTEVLEAAEVATVQQEVPVPEVQQEVSAPSTPTETVKHIEVISGSDDVVENQEVQQEVPVPEVHEVPASPEPSALSDEINPTSEHSVDDFVFENDVLIKYVGTGGKIDIPHSVVAIEESAFLGYCSITEVVIPNSVTSIGDSAFLGCDALCDVVIPESVTSIGSTAFLGCKALSPASIESIRKISPNAFEQEVPVPLASFVKFDDLPDFPAPPSNISNSIIPSKDFVVENGVLRKYIGEGTTAVIPKIVFTIGPKAFADCKDLTSIIIHNGVKSIGRNAFENCTSLPLMTIPDNITSIGQEAFKGCENLISVIIPETVKYIEDGLFEDCVNLSSIALPSSVKIVSYRAFANCSSLLDIIFLNDDMAIAEDTFEGCDALLPPSLDKIKKLKLNSFESSDEIDDVIETVEEIDKLDQQQEVPVTEVQEVQEVQEVPAPPTSPTSIDEIVDEIDGVVDEVDEKNIKSDREVFVINNNVLIKYTGSSESSSLAGDESVVVIPDNVLSIGEKAFENQDTITEVTLPNSLKSIGNNGFAKCLNLTKIEIPNSVNFIGDEAFSKCSSLSSIVIPYGVTSIGEKVAMECINLTQITLPNSISFIGEYAFNKCISLVSVTLPNSLDCISKGTFGDCSNLTQVVIPSSVTKICELAFNKCSNLTLIENIENVEQISNCAFFGCNNIAEDVKNIILSKNPLAFQPKVIPNYYTPVEEETVAVEEEVATIEEAVDETVEEETCVHQEMLDNLEKQESSFVNELASKEVPEVTEVPAPPAPVEDIEEIDEIDESVDEFEIEDNVLVKYNRNSGQVVVPDGVVEIGDLAFGGCDLIESIVLPNTVKIIGEGAFSSCNSLVRIDLPSNLDKINSAAFTNCAMLTTIEIPETVSYIGNFCFLGCESLPKEFFKHVQSIIDNSFVKSKDTPFEIEDTILINYTGSEQDRPDRSDIIIPDEVSKIADFVFEKNKNITSVKFSDNVTYIGVGAFCECTGISRIELPNSLTSVSDHLFHTCQNLTTVVLPESITVIGECSFENCNNLSSINIPSSISSIGNFAFSGCDKIDEATKAKILSFNKNAFTSFDDSDYNDRLAQSIGTGPSSKENNPTPSTFVPLTADGEEYFDFKEQEVSASQDVGDHDIVPDFEIERGVLIKYNGSASVVVVPSEVTSINEWAFDKAESVSKIIIDDNVTLIGRGAFSGCTNLTQIQLPSNIKHIYEWTFEKCSKLVEFELPVSVVGIDDSAFAHCDALPSDVTDRIVTINRRAFKI